MTPEALLTALGPLAELYADPTVTEIMVDGPQTVYVQRGGEFVDTPVQFVDDAGLRATIDALLALRGVSLAPAETTADVRLADGTHLVAVLPPTAVAHANVVLYRPPQQQPTWANLVEWGSINDAALTFLRGAIADRQRFLIAGGFNSGKTTIANLIAADIPASERLVVAEAVAEMRITHPRLVRLEAGHHSHLTLPELYRIGQRLLPDWLIIGELQGAEALAALQALRATPAGLVTIHATNTADALARLESFCLMANLGLGLPEIRGLIAAALPLVTFQERRQTGRRVVSEITAIDGVVEGRYQLRPLWRYDEAVGGLVRIGA